MYRTPEPTDAGMIHFYENIRPVLLTKYNIVVTVTLTEFEVRYAGSDKLVAVGNSIEWLEGFAKGLAVANSQIKK